MKIDRRTVIQGLCIAGTAGAFGVGISFLARKSESKTLLRPPGALEESDFLASCIKCGQCIQVCPFSSISLLDLSGGIIPLRLILIRSKEVVIYAICFLASFAARPAP